jgi:predicted nucleotide-binding protein (sugar kinase/HSP70/actin superfamily)
MVDYPDVESLGIGKANSGCKECLPYIVLAGSLMKYIKTRRRPGEKVAFFIVGDPAPCRVEQYQVGFKKLLEKNHIEDVAILTLQSDKGFAGMGLLPLLNVWKAFIVGDVFEQLHSAVMTLSKDRAKGLEVFEAEWAKILKSLSGESKIPLMKQLKSTAKELDKIELTKTIHEANRVTITGEMYVRNEQFSRQNIENTLADMGFVAKITPLIEWLYYVDYTQMKNYGNVKFTLWERIFFFMKRKVQHGIEKDIKKIFAKSSLYEYDPIDIAETMETANPLVHPKLIGDIGLTIAGGLKECLQESCGIISLGPFACLQTRMAEAILKNNMTVAGKRAVTNRSVFGDELKDLPGDMPLPYLAIESDGNPYPQIIRAQLEVFGLQAKRVGEMMQKAKAKNKK